MPTVEDIDALPIECMPAVVASLASLQARAAARLASSALTSQGGERERDQPLVTERDYSPSQRSRKPSVCPSDMPTSSRGVNFRLSASGSMFEFVPLISRRGLSSIVRERSLLLSGGQGV